MTQRNRRRTTWNDTHLNFDIASGAQASPALDVGLLTANEELTVVRTIVSLSLLMSIPGLNSGEQDVSWGIGVTSNEALTAQVFPDPNVEGDSPTRDWVIKDRTLIVDSSTAGESYMPAYVRYDIRAQRKISEGRYFMVINNSPIRGVAQSVRLFGLVRTLFMLP